MLLGISRTKGNFEHRYHMWKSYSDKDNEHIIEWNARIREVHEK
jgi:hypothetical protein